MEKNFATSAKRVSVILSCLSIIFRKAVKNTVQRREPLREGAGIGSVGCQRRQVLTTLTPQNEREGERDNGVPGLTSMHMAAHSSDSILGKISNAQI